MPGFAYSAHIGYLFTEKPMAERIASAALCGFQAIEHPAPYAVPAEEMAGWLNAAGTRYVQLGLYSGDASKGEKGLGIFPERRGEFRTNLERVNPTVDALFVYRMMAKKAREAGLASDPLIAAKVAQAQEQILAEAYMQKAQKDKLKLPDLTARAREVYASRSSDFKIPEQVHVEHILVATNDCRNREMALQKANEIRARVASADEEAFLAEAQKSSDDPSAKKNKGDLGFAPVTALEPAFAAAVAKLKRKGEVSEPVETKFGFHIIRFVGRQPERVKPFEEVKESIIAAERQKLIDNFRTGEVNAIRADPANHVFVENVEALTKSR